MKVVDWPDVDRALWLVALAPADPFAPGGGVSAGNAPISNRKTEKGYGRWLTWLDLTGQSDPVVPPGERITRDRVIAYTEHLIAIGNCSRSVLCRLQELGDMARVLAPTRSWAFIRRIASRIGARHVPARDKRSRIVMTDELLRLGMDLMADAGGQSSSRLTALGFRDGLIVALLALRPLRRKNLAGLIIGDTLHRVGAGWILRFSGASMKNRRPFEISWPDTLSPMLEEYLSVHRPVLALLSSRWARPIGDALWVSSHGSPMTQMALYDVIRDRTRAGLGRPVNPHLFRDAAATSMAIEDPDHVRLAASLLGHASPSVTEQHYQQAQSLQAHRRYHEIIRRQRGAGGETPPRCP